MSQFSAAAPIALDNLKQAAWFARLAEAATPSACATLLIELVERGSPGQALDVAWRDPASGRWKTAAGMVADRPDADLAAAALRAADGSAWAQGVAALRLGAGSRAVLLAEAPSAGVARKALDAAGPCAELVLRRLESSLDARPPEPLGRELERQAQRQCVLLALADLAAADLSIGELLGGVRRLLATQLDVHEFLVVRPGDVQATVEVFAHAGPPGAPGAVEASLRRMAELHGSPAWRVLVEGRRLEGVDVGLLPAPHAAPGGADRPWLGVPFRVRGEVGGALLVRRGHPGPAYGEGDAALLAFAAGQLAHAAGLRTDEASAGCGAGELVETLRAAHAALERETQEARLSLRREQARRLEAEHQLAYHGQHDQLTSLPNHWALRTRMEQVLDGVHGMPGRSCALLHVDIDRFRVINGSLGHVCGDIVLRDLARRLVKSVDSDTLVARLFGDEFAILLEAVASPDAALAVAERVLDAIHDALPVRGELLSPSASIGVALGSGTAALADDLRRSAEIAMRRAKRLGRNRIELFDPRWESDTRGFLGMEVRLRHALEHGEFEPYFQPLHRLADGKLVGYESLVRWHHPGLGLLLPREFLEVAEESGLIEAIDWQMFEASFRRLAEDGPADAFLTINVSGLHLSRPGFAARLLGLLDRTGLARHRLVIEVTERTLLGDPDQVRRVLLALRAQGIGAALDDFGTGYSSLSYLHSLPLTLLKIDQTFVRALSGDAGGNSSTVVAAIIALAGALDMRVIAEGIETEAQRELLAGMGCAIGQGYLLGRPAPKKRWRRLHPRVLDGAIGRHLLPLVRAGRRP